MLAIAKFFAKLFCEKNNAAGIGNDSGTNNARDCKVFAKLFTKSDAVDIGNDSGTKMLAIAKFFAKLFCEKTMPQMSE